MSENNNELFVGTPDDNVSPEDFKEVDDNFLFMTPIDDEYEEYSVQPRPFEFLRRTAASKEQKAPKVRKIRKSREEIEYDDELDCFVEVSVPEVIAVPSELQPDEPVSETPTVEKEPKKGKKKDEKKAEKAKKEEKPAKIKPEKTKKAEKKPKAEKKAKAEKKLKAEKKPKTKKTDKPKKQLKMNPSAKFILTLTFKLFLICTVVAAMLAVVNAITAPIIADNQFSEKKAIIEEFFPNITSFETLESEIDGVSAVYLIKEGDETVGYCADVISSGFSGDMNMIVGVDTGCNIKGIKIVSHAETPGFGTKVVEDAEYLKSYNDLGKTELVLGVDVDAMAGVTSTSTTVNKGVNIALAVFGEVFGELEETPAVTDEPTVPEKAVTTELDALIGLYGWVTDLEDPILYDGENPFETLIFLKAGGTNVGYIAITTASTEFETMKLLVGTWFNQVIGARVLDYDGENFDRIARDPDYLIDNYKNKTSFVYGTDIPVFEGADAEAEAIAVSVANVFKYYPTYLEEASRLTEVTPNE